MFFLLFIFSIYFCLEFKDIPLYRKLRLLVYSSVDILFFHVLFQLISLQEEAGLCVLFQSACCFSSAIVSLLPREASDCLKSSLLDLPWDNNGKARSRTRNYPPSHDATSGHSLSLILRSWLSTIQTFLSYEEIARINSSTNSFSSCFGLLEPTCSSTSFCSQNKFSGGRWVSYKEVSFQS